MVKWVEDFFSLETGRPREGVEILMSEKWRGKVKEWEEALSLFIPTKLEVWVNKCKFLVAYGLWMAETKEETEVIWF